MSYHVDPYVISLLNRLDAAESEFLSFGTPLGNLEAAPVVVQQPKATMLLRVRSQAWLPQPGAQVEVLAQLGQIVAVRATSDGAKSLFKDPNILTIEASRPGGTTDAEPSATGYPVKRPVTTELGEQCLIAIIDGGFDVLHESFHENGKTRIACVWDQGDASGPSPTDVDELAPIFSNSRGTIHTVTDIELYLRLGVVEKRLGRNGADHGTHVASIAAGRAVGDLSAGMAPAAKLLLVVPTLTNAAGEPTSIGYSVAHVEALNFIDAYAKHLDLPVVVNVSSGMNAGAHDGTSLLENAFDEFTHGGRAPGRVIVKSAGNEQMQGCHARLAPVAEGTIVLDWDSFQHAARSDEDYFEAWYDSGADLEFVLVSPSGERSNSVSAVNPSWEGVLQRNHCTMRLRPFHVDNGDSCLQLWIRADTLRIADGIWQLQIFGRRVLGPSTIDMWAERKAQSRTADLRFRQGAHAQRTLTIPATSQSVITVGAFDASSANPVLWDKSSTGPTRDGREKPDFVAPGVHIRGALAGSQNGSVGKSGTSMAAPHVAGLIALVLSACKKNNWPLPNAQQIRAVLTRTCAGYTANWHESQGFGRVSLDFNTILDMFRR